MEIVLEPRDSAASDATPVLTPPIDVAASSVASNLTPPTCHSDINTTASVQRPRSSATIREVDVMYRNQMGRSQDPGGPRYWKVVGQQILKPLPPSPKRLLPLRPKLVSHPSPSPHTYSS